MREFVSRVTRQRLAFVCLALLTAIMIHFVYQAARPQWVVFRQAENMYAAQQWEQATLLYEKSFAMGLHNPTAILRLAHSYMELKMFPQAIEWYKQYLKIHPHDAKIRRALSGAYLGNHEFDKASEQLQFIIETSKDQGE